jgi:SAM-dependent methyltransferase
MSVIKRIMGICPICKSEASQEIIPEISFELPVKEELPTQIRILYCPYCNFAYNTFSSDSSVFDEYYKRNTNDFYSDCGFYQRYKYQRDLILSLAGDRPEKVLDFGAGNGRLVSEFKRIGIEAIGIDVGTEINTYNAGKYDLIIVSHVLEHLIDPVLQIGFLSELLNEKGMIYVEVPNPANYYNHPSLEFLRYIDRLHINHFSPETMAKIASFCKLFVTDMGCFDFEYLDETSYPAAYFALKKNTRPFTSFMDSKKSLVQILKSYGKIEKKRFAKQFTDVREGYVAYGIGDNFFRTFGAAGVEDRLSRLIWCDGKFSGELLVGNCVYQPSGNKAYVFVTGPTRKSIKENLLYFGFKAIEFC